jgi:hypothetical protein
MKKNLSKNKKEANKGITLIALVITIIVLLILAGVSIATLTGENGILTQAQTSKEKTEIAEAKEQQRLNKAARIARENTDRTGRNTGWNGRRISPGAGTIMGPSGKETYYNLNMSVCVRVMRRMGFSEEEYPYEIRSDGVKTLGGLVMCAANLKLRPRGSLIETSVGPGIVVDTGGFARRNPKQLDICVNW